MFLLRNAMPCPVFIFLRVHVCLFDDLVVNIFCIKALIDLHEVVCVDLKIHNRRRYEHNIRGLRVVLILNIELYGSYPIFSDD